MSREIEYIKNNQIEILEAKNTILEVQMSLIGLNKGENRLKIKIKTHKDLR